jgi:hypothetical protein
LNIGCNRHLDVPGFRFGQTFSANPAKADTCHDSTTLHLISEIELSSKLTNLWAEILEKHTASKSSIACFPDLLPGADSLENVYAWVIANFGLPEVGESDGDPDSSLSLEISNDPGTEAPTFGPFCSIYIFFLAAAKGLDSIMSEGDTLRDGIHTEGRNQAPL